MKPLEYNKVFVIESLHEEDKPKTGQLLFNDIIKRRHENSELILVNSKAEFFGAFDKVRDETINKLVNPIIHLELHGSKTGLEINDRTSITWEELQFRLSELNFICGGNLFITLATCYGGFIHKAIKPNLRAPFWGFVGAFEEVFYPEILSNFNAFYDEFLQSQDLKQAVIRLNKANENQKSPFQFQNTEYAFKIAYENYEKKYLTPEMVEKRLGQGLIEARKFPELSSWKDESVKNMLKFYMVDSNDLLKEDMMRNFFMWDVFPQNRL
ncbi:MAG: hypothetical protein ACOYBS_11285 [Flavobacterium sp.]